MLRHGPTLSMYYADPDDNQLEFQIDLLDADAANAIMRSAAFAANPIAVSRSTPTSSWPFSTPANRLTSSCSAPTRRPWHFLGARADVDEPRGILICSGR
jgi:hypothetical protein